MNKYLQSFYRPNNNKDDIYRNLNSLKSDSINQH